MQVDDDMLPRSGGVVLAENQLPASCQVLSRSEAKTVIEGRRGKEPTVSPKVHEATKRGLDGD